MSPYLSSALGSFRLLVKDYAVLLEYVHPTDSNARVYSHRTFELLLRACTEFESLAKHAALERSLIAAHEQPRIAKLSVICESMDLSGTEVGVLAWEPDTLFLTPLDGWASRPHTLGWYRAYNSVKHNRAASFSEATLQNVTLALAACFLLLQRLGALPLASALIRVDHETFKTEWHFSAVPFTLRTPNDWSPHLRGESAA